jgi:hypothetical protein
MSKSAIFKISIEKFRFVLSKQNTKYQNVIFQKIQVLWVIYKVGKWCQKKNCNELFLVGKFNVSMALHEFVYAMNKTFKKLVTRTKELKWNLSWKIFKYGANCFQFKVPSLAPIPLSQNLFISKNIFLFH